MSDFLLAPVTVTIPAGLLLLLLLPAPLLALAMSARRNRALDQSDRLLAHAASIKETFEQLGRSRVRCVRCGATGRVACKGAEAEGQSKS